MVNFKSILAATIALASIATATPTPTHANSNLQNQENDKAQNGNSNFPLSRRTKASKPTTTIYQTFPTIPSIASILSNYSVPWPVVSLNIPQELLSNESVVKIQVTPATQLSLWTKPHDLNSWDLTIPPTPFLPLPDYYNSKDEKKMKGIYKDALKDFKEFMDLDLGVVEGTDFGAKRIEYSNKLRSYILDVYCTHLDKDECTQLKDSEKTIHGKLYKKKEYSDLRDFTRKGASVLLGRELVYFLGGVLEARKAGKKSCEGRDIGVGVGDEAELEKDFGYKSTDFFRDGVWKMEYFGEKQVVACPSAEELARKKEIGDEANGVILGLTLGMDFGLGYGVKRDLIPTNSKDNGKLQIRGDEDVPEQANVTEQANVPEQADVPKEVDKCPPISTIRVLKWLFKVLFWAQGMSDEEIRCY